MSVLGRLEITQANKQHSQPTAADTGSSSRTVKQERAGDRHTQEQRGTMRLLGVVMVPCCLSRGFVPAGQRGVVGRGFNAAGLRRRGADAGSSAVIGRSGAHLFAAACTPARLVCCRRVCSLVHDRHVRACVSGTQYVCAQYAHSTVALCCGNSAFMIQVAAASHSAGNGSYF